MREKRYIEAVNKRVPKKIHRQSMTSASLTTNGTPDYYYDGPARDLWVEYKRITSMPRDGTAKGAYTALQLHWMERRYRNSLAHGPNVIGVVGLPNRLVCLQRTPTEWREGTSVDKAMTLVELALWITAFCSQSSD